jgi:nucleoid-associated protein YgaU
VPLQSIIDLNELKRPDHIEPGQVLLIPIGESVATPSP